MLVLELQGAVADEGLAAGQLLAKRVGIAVAAGEEEVEGRVGVGRALFVGGQLEGAGADPHRSGGQAADGRQRAEQAGESRPEGNRSEAPGEVWGHSGSRWRPAAEASSR